MASRLNGFEYGALERPDSCLWTADQEALKKAAARLRYLEKEVTRLRALARASQAEEGG